MYHVFRLVKNQDLKQELIKYCNDHNIKAAVILSGVGCLLQLHIRLADGESNLLINDNYEIVSITGTLSDTSAHIHISCSDIKGDCLGGHLNDGCLINTTCEVCLLELENYEFTRSFDINTGYDELDV